MSLVFQIGMRNEGSRRWLEWKGDVVKDERSLITCRGGEKKVEDRKESTRTWWSTTTDAVESRRRGQRTQFLYTTQLRVLYYRVDRP